MIKIPKYSPIISSEKEKCDMLTDHTVAAISVFLEEKQMTEKKKHMYI